MTKSEYCKKHGVTVRPVTRKDMEEARTDYQRLSSYIIAYNGVEWYSKRTTLNDIKAVIDYENRSRLDYDANGRMATA